MEKLKHYNDTLALGKLIVKELELEPTDTLGRWMALHISELISKVESSDDTLSQEIEQRCFETILTLWKHIRSFPRGHRPLEDIEPLIATIQALSPENKAYFYQSDAQSLLKDSSLPEETKNWLGLAHGLDYSARLLIKMCLTQAASDIKDSTQDWFELSKSLEADIPITQIVRFVSDEPSLSDEEAMIEAVKKKIETLNERRERLEGILSMSELLMSSIDNDIKELEQSLKVASETRNKE